MLSFMSLVNINQTKNVRENKQEARNSVWRKFYSVYMQNTSVLFIKVIQLQVQGYAQTTCSPVTVLKIALEADLSGNIPAGKCLLVLV